MSEKAKKPGSLPVSVVYAQDTNTLRSEVVETLLNLQGVIAKIVKRETPSKVQIADLSDGYDRLKKDLGLVMEERLTTTQLHIQYLEFDVGCLEEENEDLKEEIEQLREKLEGKT